MFRHYLSASITTFKRFSIQLSLAMFSLIIGLTGAAVLLLYAYQEFSHDDYIPNAENIYRIESTRLVRGEPLHSSIIPRALPYTFDTAFDDIDLLTRIVVDQLRQRSLIVGEKKYARIAINADENFFKIFNLPTIYGNLEQFYKLPDSIVITKSTSIALFGDADPTGKTLYTNMSAERLLTIVAVIEDMPRNVHLIGDFIFRIDENVFSLDTDGDLTNIQNWQRNAYRTYFTLNKGANPSEISSKLPQFVKQYVPESLREETKIGLNIVSVKDIYFHGATFAAMKPLGNIDLVYGFITIASILIIISSFNFTNLMLAVHNARRKEMALRKVAGASRSQLLVHITTEIAVLIIGAIVFSKVLAQLLLPFFNQVFLVSLSQNLFENPNIALGYGAILIVVVVFSSLSPSRMVGNIRPVLVLSGSELQQKGSKLIRNSFLTIQFAIAVALIPIVIVVLDQVSFAEHKDMGFKKEGVIAIRSVNSSEMYRKVDTLIQEIADLPYVTSTTSSLEVPGDHGIVFGYEVYRTDHLKEIGPIYLEGAMVGYDYFKTYGINILTGRTFSKDVYLDNAIYLGKPFEKQTNILMNEAAIKALGFTSPQEALGHVVKLSFGGNMEGTVIGVVPDINFISLKKGIKPEVYINLSTVHSVVSIAFETHDTQTMIDDLKGIWKKLGATTPLDYVFVQDNWNKAYADDRMAANIFTVFAMIGVLISLAGIYSVMLFETSKQLHEVAIRKVMGGSIRDIMKLLMLKSSVPVIIACLIALPLAWYGLGQWLNGYVDRIALDPLVFIGSGLAMLVISWITVGSHAYKVASAKPAEALRNQ